MILFLQDVHAPIDDMLRKACALADAKSDSLFAMRGFSITSHHNPTTAFAIGEILLYSEPLNTPVFTRQVCLPDAAN